MICLGCLLCGCKARFKVCACKEEMGNTRQRIIKNKRSLGAYNRDWGKERNKIKRYPKLFKLLHILTWSPKWVVPHVSLFSVWVLSDEVHAVKKNCKGNDKSRCLLKTSDAF